MMNESLTNLDLASSPSTAAPHLRVRFGGRFRIDAETHDARAKRRDPNGLLKCLNFETLPNFIYIYLILA